jgi:peptidyl-dipeptidase A
MSIRLVTRVAGALAIGLMAAGSCPVLFAQGTGEPAPTVTEAEAFIQDAEARLNELGIRSARAQWVAANFITLDTQALAAEANERFVGATTELAKAATRFEGLDLPPDLARKIRLLKLSLAAPGPSDPAELSELTSIAASLEAAYGSGRYCPEGRECVDLTALERVFRESRDPQQLLDAWTGWRTISVPMRERYARFVELSNKGAREMGFEDAGVMWRSNYDMPPDAFRAEVERLWQQVRPLYESLHAYVRARLATRYGPDVVPPGGMIPAHLLGNMWAQQWAHVYDLVAPAGLDRGYDLTELLKAQNLDARGMVKYGEAFFSSLGFAPLPETFWERSLFVKPQDRDVVCHASAWTLDNRDDIRLKMCIEVEAEDFVVIHHELGHNYYQRAYNHQPFLFQGSANDGFHEAVGDAIALSVTPDYLKRVGLLDKVPPPESDIPLLLRDALDKVAFLPFGLLVDQWRWGVFSGAITPDTYNQTWWTLRNKYQGVSAPVARSERDFDPGAKYHIPANVPYTRYFLAHVLQFQFHRALCREAGYTGPLNRCSIYGSTAAGDRLNRMLAMGLSRPWPDALEAMTGERKMDANALMEYFAPLKAWLDEQNEGQKIGW